MLGIMVCTCLETGIWGGKGFEVRKGYTPVERGRESFSKAETSQQHQRQRQHRAESLHRMRNKMSARLV